MADCIFCKITAGEIPSSKVYENEYVYAFRDINPQAPVHILVIPKEHIASVAEITPENSMCAAKCMEAVAEIAKVAQEGGLSVIIFTGCTYDAILKSENLIWLNLLKHIDLLIDGPYVEEKREFSRPWVGSSNQNFYYLTDCFKEEEKSLETIKNKIEIRIETNGEISINGMGDYKKVMNILMEQNRRSNGKDKN